MPPRPKAKLKDFKPTDLVTVVGPPSGRRRAGHRFGPEPTQISFADLSEEQIEALLGDPALVVTIGPAIVTETVTAQT